MFENDSQDNDNIKPAKNVTRKKVFAPNLFMVEFYVIITFLELLNVLSCEIIIIAGRIQLDDMCQLQMMRTYALTQWL